MTISLKQSTTAADVARKAVQKIQADNFETDVEEEMNYYHSQCSESTWRVVQFKWSSQEHEEVLKCPRDDTPERGGTKPKIMGRSKTR